ncbi:unnamed protein product, partial [Amoebophrya sp. A25]|eukprot:GSA25T00021912001.1
MLLSRPLGSVQPFLPRLSLAPREVETPQSLISVTSAAWKPLLCLIDLYNSAERFEVPRLLPGELGGLRLTKEGVVLESVKSQAVESGWRLVSSRSFPFERIVQLNKAFEKDCPDAFYRLKFQIEGYFVELEHAGSENRLPDLNAFLDSATSTSDATQSEQARDFFRRFVDDEGCVFDSEIR